MDSCVCFRFSECILEQLPNDYPTGYFYFDLSEFCNCAVVFMSVTFCVVNGILSFNCLYCTVVCCIVLYCALWPTVTKTVLLVFFLLFLLFASTRQKSCWRQATLQD